MINKEFSVNASPELDVHIQSGRIEIKSGRLGVVKVDVETNDAGFVVEQRGDQVHISSDKNAGWFSRDSAFVVIETPDGTDAVIGTANAKVETHAALGSIDIKTASGDIEIDSAEHATIKSASGDAKIGSVSGDLKVSSASGDVHVGETGGKVTFSSASGDLHLRTTTGPVTASTASGDISLMRFEGRQANIKSMSGEALIGVPAGTRLDLDATLLSGEMNTPSPSGNSQPIERRMTVKAKLVSGDLTIRRV